MRSFVVPLLLTALLGGCVTADVFGIVGDENDLYTGSATGYMSRTGTIELTNAKGNRCAGRFAYGAGLYGHGIITCDDGQSANIRFVGLSSTSGYGSGVSTTGRPVSFAYGLGREESRKYLGLARAGAGAASSGGSGGSPPAATARGGSGTGFFVSRQGHILTNAHVVRQCKEITATRQGGGPVAASLVRADANNDLAVLIATPSSSVAALRGGRAVRQGESVIAYGYPLPSMLASGGIMTNGNISALSGLRDDSRYLQISTPIQPGNSGGPLLDMSGAVVGVVTASISEARVARTTGAIPQNINFALKADVARTFLDSAGVPVETAGSGRDLALPEVSEKARGFTVYIECKT